MIEFLTGGLSLVVLVCYWIASATEGQFAFVSQRVEHSLYAFSFLTLVMNHPHFSSSYFLAYGRGRREIFRRWFELILVPLVLFMLLIYVGIDWNSRGATWVSGLVHFLLLTSSWHYTQQTFGLVIVLAARRGEILDVKSRRLLRGHLLLLGLSQILRLNSQPENALLANFHGTEVASLGFDPLVAKVALALTLLTGVCSFLSLRRQVSLSCLIPWLAMISWYIPIGSGVIFYLLAVPFFHSLQYLVLAMPAMTSRFRFSEVSLFLLLTLTGWLGFEFFPNLIDDFLGEAFQGTRYTVLAAALFINIHHFFIDSVIWKRGEGVLEHVLADHRKN